MSEFTNEFRIIPDPQRRPEDLSQAEVARDEAQSTQVTRDLNKDISSQGDNARQGSEDTIPSDLCDAWKIITSGGFMDYKGTYYEVRRVPGTLSDRLMNEDDIGLLPSATSPGVMIEGDKVEPMNLEQVDNRKKYFNRDIGWGQDADGRWTDGEGLKDIQLALASDIFKSLPLVQFDESIHHAKLPRSTQEIRNLIAVQGDPYLVQLIGRSDNDRLITLKFGKDLTSLLMDFLPEGGRAAFPEEWKYQWVVDIVLGLSNLHKMNILHADLTTNNILYDRDHAILCDLESGPHTSHLIPPELAQGIVKKFNAKMDMYGLGTLIWSIENRNMPRLHRKLQFTGVFADLMGRCMADDPDERPTIEDVISELRKFPQTRSLFPSSDGITLSETPHSSMTIGSINEDKSQTTERSLYYVEKKQELPWMEWLYTWTGVIIRHEGVFFEITRIPGTYSDRVINQRADLPVVPWSGARIIADCIQQIPDEEVKQRLSKYNVDDDGNLMEPAYDVEIEAEDFSAVQQAIRSTYFQSLPIVKYDPKIHYAKPPRSTEEIKNLLAVKGLSHLVQIVGRTQDDQLITDRHGQSLVEGWQIAFGTKLPEEWKHQWVVDIVLALRNLHSKGILHNDLSLRNVLFKEDHAILCDLEAGPKTIFEPLPESIFGLKEYNARSEMYYLGVLMWEIENWNTPRRHSTLESSGVFADIMGRCLEIDPKDRPTLDQVISHLRQLPETSSLFPDEETTGSEDAISADRETTAPSNRTSNSDTTQQPISEMIKNANQLFGQSVDGIPEFFLNRDEGDDCLDWTHTRRGGIVKYNGRIYEIVRIPDTYSDRVMNDTADLPLVPWVGAKILGDLVEEMTQIDVDAILKEAGYDLNLEPVEIDEDEETANYTGAKALAIECEIYQTLPLVEYNEHLHYAKVPSSVVEVENLIAVQGVPYIVQLVGRTPDHRILTKRFGEALMEWIVDRQRKVPEERKIRWMIDIANGIRNLHHLHILHKDIWANNILISEDQAMLCDLESYHKPGGADAPELCLGQSYTEKSDIYAFGKVLWAVENRNHPRAHRALLHDCAGIFKEIMVRCLATDPGDRPTIDWIIEELQKLQTAIAHVGPKIDG